MEVKGEIPKEIDGTFYRVMPDPQVVPFIENDPVSAPYALKFNGRGHALISRQWFNGDGNISAFRIHDGRCHFKQRYVRTEKFLREREAQKALLGRTIMLALKTLFCR